MTARMDTTSYKHGAVRSARLSPECRTVLSGDRSFSAPLIHRTSSCACGGGCPACQEKSNELRVSQPHDPAEQEADRVADQIMRMPVGEVKPVHSAVHADRTIHRGCDTCNDESETVQRKALSSHGTTSSQTPAHVHDAISSGGHPLDHETRRFFEPRLGYDLAGVRIHTGSTAELSAKAINARAYTLRRDIVFGSGEYRPDSESGRHLLAHELAHAIQQSNVSEALPSSPSQGVSLAIRSSEVGLSRSPDAGRKAVVCPGGGPPLNGVCMSDEILDALPQAYFDLEKAQEMVLADEAKTARARRRQERTINTFESDKLASLVAEYQEALEQYLSKQDDTTKRHYRSALRQLQRRYHHLVDLFLKDPKFEKKYDLRSLQQIVGEQSPQIAAYRAQDINEYLSMPQWNDNERRQMEQLKKAIGGWTGEEQELARNLLWRWFELARGGRHPSTAKDTIIDMTEQHLEQWLRAADRAREQDCKQNPMGTVEKLYRIHGIDRCKPWFDNEHPHSTNFHGSSELFDFRMKMNLRLSEKESPESLVFECVQQYRQETNIDEQLKAMQAQALVGMGLHLTSIASTYSMVKAANLRVAPATTSASSNLLPDGVGRIIDTPMGPQRVRAIMPNGDLVLDLIVNWPPANRALSSGLPGSLDVPTAKPTIGVGGPVSGTFMPSQTAPFEAQTALPPGSIFLQEPPRAPVGLAPGPPFLSQTQSENLKLSLVSPLSTTPPPMANVALGEIVSPHAPALGLSVPGPNQPNVYVRFQPQTFATQDAAAIDALKLSNPYSIAAGRELAGQTFQTPQGRWGYSGPVMIPEEQSISKGRVDSRPEDAAVHPDWGIATGDFHTHGSYQSVREGILLENPRWKPDDFRLQQTPWEPDTMLWQHTGNLEIKMLPDEFSFADIQRLTVIAREAGVRWTSYVGTPSGKFRMMYSNPEDGPSKPVVIYPPGR